MLGEEVIDPEGDTLLLLCYKEGVSKLLMNICLYPQTYVTLSFNQRHVSSM